MATYLRTNYRITGDSIDSGSLAIAAGSSATAAAANPVGQLRIAHGLATTPTFAYGAPLCANTSDAVGREVRVLGQGSTYLTFVTVSALVESASATLVTSALSSSVVMTFVWAAFG